jgi:ABC-type amino acid transport substrate-binding protein
MMVLANNNEINHVEDIKGKVIGAQAFSDFAGAQAQFYVMDRNGLDYSVDPKQVIFTGR